MHTLVICAEGLDSTGLGVTLDALNFKWPGHKHIALVSSKPCPWTGSATNMHQHKLPTYKSEKRGDHPNFYNFSGTPIDAVYFALANFKELLGFDQQFDMVLTGVHHGRVVGMDVLHAADFFAALVAARVFGVPALAFAQDMPRAESGAIDRRYFATSDRVLRNVLDSIVPLPGECVCINFPAGSVQSLANAFISNYHPLVPKSQSSPFFRSQRDDITQLDARFITVCQAALEVNVPHQL